ILAALTVLLALVVIVQLTSGSGSPTAGAPTPAPAGTTAPTAPAEPAPSSTPADAAEAPEPPAGPETGAEPQPEPVRVERRDPDDPMAIGDVDAPVVLVEWVDMRCPYCAMFGRETLPTLVEEYVE